MIYQIIYITGLFILGSIAFLWILAMIRLNHSNRYEDIDVVCAGSVDHEWPSTVRIKMIEDPLIKTGQISKNDFNKSQLKKFVVRGNSMQYANINTDDIVYIKLVDVNAIKNSLPQITLLTFDNSNCTNYIDCANHKIRRTWKIVSPCISETDLKKNIIEILESQKFNELRTRMKQYCPNNIDLINWALERFHSFKNKKNNNLKGRSQILISTTFCTEKNRLEFSIHSSDDLKGIVKYVAHKNCI